MHNHILKTTALLIILIFLPGNAPAAENDSTVTDQLFNGHMWQLLNESQKTTHLTGIQEGIKLCLSQIKEDLLIPSALMHSIQESGIFDRRRMLFSVQGVSGISKRIDVFYRDAGNLAIPIIEAYRHVTLALNFSDPQDVAQDLARLKLKFKK
ncbi:MAG: hypothetical protein KJP23_07655 [Deltaproteobacteria bacterium]|nr:hypothetical protein [Deltaproteobacteria bacterium]